METIELLERQELTQLEEEKEEVTAKEAANETKASKRNKAYDLGDVRVFTERNAEVDYKILLALYEHRALTSTQIRKVWFPQAHENSIRNRMKALTERRILTVNIREGTKSRPIKFYSLSAFGLRIVTENILQVMEYESKFDERKEHYTLHNLKVRGQHNHHYELQEWVTDVLSKIPGLFHCEWRRFPFVEDWDSPIHVKPDWVFLEADEETVQMTKEDAANNPLLYPYLYRKEFFKDIAFTPILCAECDRGTMTRVDLVEKWERYRTLPDQYKPQAISMFYTPKKHGDMRHRLIRDTMSYVFELEVARDEVQLFEGDPILIQEVVSLYLERGKNLLFGEEMTNERELIDLVEAYNRTLETGEISVIDVEKTVQHLKLPIKPNAMIAKEQNGTSLQLVFYALPCWVNPLVKIQSFKRWLKEGHLAQFSDIQYILMYPDNSFLHDVRPMDDDIRFVSFKEIKGNGMWGNAHYELRKYRQVNWREVTL